MKCGSGWSDRGADTSTHDFDANLLAWTACSRESAAVAVTQSNDSESLEVAWLNPACPWLPAVDSPQDFRLTRRHGSDKGSDFYGDALVYAQSQWRMGKPAQAILQLDKAWMADLPPDEWRSRDGVDPYQALIWIMQTLSAGAIGYMGNPVRHFQHLASRMSGQRSEVRSWRAWLCLHLAEKWLTVDAYPRDGQQMARYGLWIPGKSCALTGLFACGWEGEAEHVAGLLKV